MAEYIEREALIAEFKRLSLGENSFIERLFADGVYSVIETFPAADVAEVKHGEWLTPQNDTIRGQKFTCSVCGKIAYYPQPTRLKNWVKHCSYEYCPHCGAKMDGKGER